MSTSTRVIEAGNISAAYQIALAHIGAATVDDALSLWQDLPSNATPAQVSRWVAKVLKVVMGRRGAARELAISYYRLVRALQTGYTVPHPDTPGKGTTVKLDELRQDFLDQVEAAQALAPREGAVDRGGAVNRDREFLQTLDPLELPKVTDDNGDIKVEPTLRKLLQESDGSRAAAEAKAKLLVEQLGINRLQKKLEELDTKESAESVDKQRDDERARAGASQAAGASLVAKDAARGLVHQASREDPRAVGFVRVTDGDPCYFCAMLASRGLVLYKSARSAKYTADGDLYHPNCNCQAEPVFSKEHYAASDRFELNRELTAEWRRVIGDGDVDLETRMGGSTDPLNVWRRYWNKKRRARSSS